MMTKTERIELFGKLNSKLSEYLKYDVEEGIVNYYLQSIGIDVCATENAKEISLVLEEYLPADLETIVEFFESLVEQDNKDENGVVYTPKYISDYIVSTAFDGIDKWSDNISIIDPACGGGIFLVSAAEWIVKRFGVPIDQVIQNNIYGIELDEDNARRCSLVLKLLSAKHGGDYLNITPHVKCHDSLKCDWAEIFNLGKKFDFVIGNPPYVNPHDMNKETVKFLKKSFLTTQKGVFNIFYAFIEKAMSSLERYGLLGFIVPNNFLTIKSAEDLRELIENNSYLTKIIDFGDNMVFKPVRTYNCIIFLSNSKSESFKFYVMPRVDDIEIELVNNAAFLEMPIHKLDRSGWKLVDGKTYENISRIEGQMVPIKQFIRTGIATLRDNVYFVEMDEKGYFKVCDGQKYYIEKGLVKPIYKIPELKLHDQIDEAERHIIFPYIKSTNGYTLIPEDSLRQEYPLTYDVLLKNKTELDSRDKGKGNPYGWYAYGRTQGLNKYGKKLLFPTFSNIPKFTYLDNEDALFCNGYAIFENDQFDLDVLLKILNSALMQYYVSNTSYPIEGGYYCYQKRYIERFSIPWLTPDNIDFLKNHTGKEVDRYLIDLYGLNL